MGYDIHIENKADYDWLAHLLSKSYEKIKREPASLSGIAEHVINLTDAVNKATVTKPKDDKPKHVADTKYEYNYCKQHTTYTAKRPPRKECDQCWGAYKKLNPNTYDLARRKFERKNA